MNRPLRSVHPRAVRAPQIVGTSLVLHELIQQATRVARSDAKVLITGESGVGKDLFARHVHAHSDRAAQAYIAVNCAGLVETLLESELFGHLRGSFTGAHRDRPGVVQLAHGGTLFLDEVGEMSLRMQALLLRFLETGEIHPVGADGATFRADVRLVAATNRNLAERVAAGEFREDLLYRLRVVHLHIPPLRERPEDVRCLVDHVLEREPRRAMFTPEALAQLERYRWPGNVRELQNVVEQALWTASGEMIGVEHLPPSVRPGPVALVPRRDRRRQVADPLYDELVAGRLSFWDDIHRLFLDRDITRHDLRGVVSRGLVQTRGNYRLLVRLFRLPAEDYKRLLNFLGTHDCRVDVQPFRLGTADPRALPSRGSLGLRDSGGWPSDSLAWK